MVRAISRTFWTLVPAFSARSAPRWMTGPSAMGSEKGTPSSIRSTPPRSSAATSAGVRSGEGSPAVMYAISALCGAPLDGDPLNTAWIRVGFIEFWKVFAIDVRVLIAAAGQVDQEQLPSRSGRPSDRLGHGMRRFKRRDDTFGPGE